MGDGTEERLTLGYRGPDRRGFRLREWWTPWVVVPVTIGIISLSGALFWPILKPSRHPPAYRMICESRLRQIGQACLLYAAENHGFYSPSFSLLFTTEDLELKCCVCPIRATTWPTTYPSESWLTSTSDFVYLGAGLDSRAPGDIIVAHERLPNHSGHNVLHADGSVDWFEPAAFQKELARSNGVRRRWEASTRPSGSGGLPLQGGSGPATGSGGSTSTPPRAP